MNDREQRQRDRRAVLVASPRDLAARLRTGDLLEHQLRLAAYCGHRAAQLHYGDGPVGWLDALGTGAAYMHDIVQTGTPLWARGLVNGWGLEPCVRAGYVLAELINDQAPEAEPTQALQAVEAWLLMPSQLRQQQCRAHYHDRQPAWIRYLVSMVIYEREAVTVLNLVSLIDIAEPYLEPELTSREVVCRTLTAWALGRRGGSC